MAPRKAKKAKTAASWDEVMDPSGDLTLVVGEEKVKLRCARNILILSSPVLKRMLDPESPFMEGNVTDVSDDGTKHINLPEDEPEPLSLVLRIIHHKTEDVPSKVPLDLLVELAILSDKYDLLCCIGQWTSSWCDGYTDQDARAWLFVGFVFKNPEAFRKASKSLILNGTLSDRKLFDTKTEIDGVPSWVLSKRHESSVDRGPQADSSLQGRYEVATGLFSISSLNIAYLLLPSSCPLSPACVAPQVIPSRRNDFAMRLS